MKLKKYESRYKTLNKQPLGNLSRGLLFVISAPAGTGKTTLVNLLTNEFPCVIRSISCTTRKPRPEERDGRDYFFVSPEEFQRKLGQGEFLEHATVFGASYGTPRSFIESAQAQGQHVILVIDTQGALQLKNKVKATFIFISPPSLEELKKRLYRRSTETAQKIEERVQIARQELEKISHYDYHLVNDDLAVAYTVLKSILIAEEHRRQS